MESADTRSHKYMDIYNVIKNDIILNKYHAEALLPSEAKLMKEFGAGRNTVRHALAMLKDDGYITSRQGSGATVLPQSSSIGGKSTQQRTFAADFGIKYFAVAEKVTYSETAAETRHATPAIAEAFGIEPGDAVPLMQRIWFINGDPYIYMRQYINPRIFTNFTPRPETDGKEIYKVIKNELGMSLLDGTEIIRCKNADFIEANLLGLEPGSAVLFIVRTSQCEAGTFEYTEFVQNSDYAGYYAKLGEGAGFPEEVRG